MSEPYAEQAKELRINLVTLLGSYYADDGFGQEKEVKIAEQWLTATFARVAQEARAQALEEAAQIADKYLNNPTNIFYYEGQNDTASVIGSQIRALKESQP